MQKKTHVNAPGTFSSSYPTIPVSIHVFPFQPGPALFVGIFFLLNHHEGFACDRIWSFSMFLY